MWGAEGGKLYHRSTERGVGGAMAKKKRSSNVQDGSVSLRKDTISLKDYHINSFLCTSVQGGGGEKRISPPNEEIVGDGSFRLGKYH